MKPEPEQSDHFAEAGGESRPAGAETPPAAPRPSKLSKPAVLCLAAILAAAAAVRVVGLGRVPPPMFRDEAEKGYNAYCLAATGRDYEGRRLPLFINVFGVFTSAIYQYAAVPWVALFGPEPWSVRLTAALVGLATVGALFGLGRALFDTATALVAAAILALSPWHVCFSRWAQQGIFLPLLFTLAAWGVVRFRKGRAAGLPVAAVALALAAYAYSVGRVLAPLFLFLLAWVARGELHRRKGWAVGAALLFAVVAAPTFYFVTHQSEIALARFRRISIIRPDREPRQIAGEFLVNYAKHFDPLYLAVRGDRQMRHSPPGVGEIYPLELLLLVLGVWFLARKGGAPAAIVIGWILIAPVASSLTREGIPHSLRSLAGVPAFALAAAVGLVEGVRRAPRRWRPWLIGLAAAAEIGAAAYFLADYFTAYPRESQQAWQAGFGEALAYCRTHSQDAEQVWISGAFGLPVGAERIISPGEILVAFYEKIPPRQFQRNRLRGTRFHVLPWGANINLLLTGSGGPPKFAIAFVAEMSGRTPLVVFADKPQADMALGVYRF